MSAGTSKRKVGETVTDNTSPNKKRKDEKPGKASHHAIHSSKPKPYDRSFVKKGPSNDESTSRESHAKQKAIAHERKAAKPHADSVQRSKKLWERLRRKSHVPKSERDELVQELFSIVTGHVKDFVFKHDSVRVVQCALKYANTEQRKTIAQELRGEYRKLAESRYAKFLVGKLLVQADEETVQWIVGEFYGGVKKLINHPEASWILDDTYRGVATSSQKSVLLREWYGPEFVHFKNQTGDRDQDADLARILELQPEKKKSIMEYLLSLINQLVQKKLTGFTMLHDAMLQYFLNVTPGTEEANEFLELLKSDDEGDLLKNLAFTASGSKLVCYALAYGNAKDRKNILRVYKDHIETLAFDPNGHLVLLAAYDLVDDTVLTSKLIFPELLGTKIAADAQQARILAMATHAVARIPLLYPLASGGQNNSEIAAKWLIPPNSPTAQLIAALHSIRTATSKKDPETRRKELVRGMSTPPVLLGAITECAADLVLSSFGCQFATEVLLEVDGDKADSLRAVAALAAGDPNEDGHIMTSAGAGRMLKTLVLGGRFDTNTKSVVYCEPRLNFGNILYEHMEGFVGKWATGTSSFVVLNLLEAEDFERKADLRKELTRDRADLDEAAAQGNAGAKLILKQLA